MFESDACMAHRPRVIFPSEFEADYEDRILAEARGIAQRRLSRLDFMRTPAAARDYLSVRLATYAEEVFACLFLDARHCVIAFEILFRGTIDGCNVHPRVIATRVLLNNAAAVILAHNHPSGVVEPSKADEVLTREIKEALALFDVRLLDHFIVGRQQVASMAEQGLV